MEWFERRHWDELPVGMPPCAQYNINVSCTITYNKQVYEHAHMVVFHGRGYDFALKNLITAFGTSTLGALYP